MNAFTRAAATLVADPNLGADVTYARVDAAWSPLALRAVLSQPLEELGLAQTRGVVAPRLQAMVPAAALPAIPAELDTLTLADATVWEVSFAEQDVTGATWTLHLKRLSAALTDDAGRRLTDDLRAGLTA